jgi:DNA-binding response OmpR family regulator
VESATDGPAGLTRALGERFDLIVLDIMLPGKNGFEVCRELRRQGRDVAILILTAKSQLTDRVVGLKLLRYLIDHRGAVVPREELLQAVWEYQPGVSSRTIDVHVAWLRQKLEDNPQYPQYIHTVRGVGYRFSG